MKSNSDNFLSMEVLNSNYIYIFKKQNDIIIKYSGFFFKYTPQTFNFSIDKPILNITIIHDKYGQSFKNIFNREYWKAATIIQNKWKQIKF